MADPTPPDPHPVPQPPNRRVDLRRRFFTALMFYTRLPAPSDIDHSANALNRATVFFPVIGWLVGGAMGLTFWLAQLQLFSPEVSLLLATAVGLVLTGAFHEDGLADFFDGFGGGWTPEQVLDIMKDSRVGTYGLVGTLVVQALKFFALLQLLPSLTSDVIPVVLIMGHSLSRLSAGLFIRLLPYVQLDAQSKVKPVAQSLPTSDLAAMVLLGLAPMAVWFSPIPWFGLAALAMFVYVFRLQLKKRLGGYTGDCLGAAQQLSETIFYLYLAAAASL